MIISQEPLSLHSLVVASLGNAVDKDSIWTPENSASPSSPLKSMFASVSTTALARPEAVSRTVEILTRPVRQRQLQMLRLQIHESPGPCS